MSERLVVNLAKKTKSFHGIPVKIPPAKKNKKRCRGRVCRITAVKMKSYWFSHPASQRQIMLILTHQCSVIIILFALAKQMEKEISLGENKDLDHIPMSFFS